MTVTRTPTDHRPPATTRSVPRTTENLAVPFSQGRWPRPQGGSTPHLVGVGRIRADRIQVSTRPALGVAEILALVEGLEQLIDAGYETVDVVLEGREVQATGRPRPTPDAGLEEADRRTFPADRHRADARALTTARNPL